HDFVSDERIVWVDIEGIPLNVWSRESFMRIAHSSFSEEVSGDDNESDVEEVYETIFGDNSSSPNNNSDEMGKQHFEDPFKIYDILKKQTGGETCEEINRESVDPNVVKEGGSILGVLEDMIRVGQAMRYIMDGCVKDFECIIRTQGADDVSR
nr:RNA-directed DNA polymerase, eukaryota [Tanacetum cinerariifolium]